MIGMTREEAIRALRVDNGLEIRGDVTRLGEFLQGLFVAISALRGPTREMVERMFPGCKMCKPVCHKCKNYPLALYPLACKTCIEHSNFEAVSNFCEDCGRPMTDEAVDMVMERMEALYEKID